MSEVRDGEQKSSLHFKRHEVQYYYNRRHLDNITLFFLDQAKSTLMKISKNIRIIIIIILSRIRKKNVKLNLKKIRK